MPLKTLVPGGRSLHRTKQIAAAIGAAALLAGCGTAAVGSSSTTATSANGDQFNPQLVSTQTTANLPPAVGSKSTKSPKPKKRKQTATGAKSNSSAAATTAAKPAASGSSAAVTKTVTVTRTITVMRPTVLPSVPPGAHVPSSLAPLAYSSFSAQGGVIGCHLGGGAARCDIASSSWSPPRRPHSCTLAWGQGLAVGPTGAAHFVCAGDSVLDPSGSAVPAGRDDRVGSVTCQVRTIGVTCFDATGQGFFVGRTGYYLF